MKTTRLGYTVATRCGDAPRLFTYHITITPKRAAVREVYPNGRVSNYAGHYDPQTIDRRFPKTITEAWDSFRDDTQRLLTLRQAEVLQLQNLLQQIAFHVAQLPADDADAIEDAQLAHRMADPHCTCNDCIADHITNTEDTEGDPQ